MKKIFTFLLLIIVLFFRINVHTSTESISLAQTVTTIETTKPKVIYLISTPRSCSTAFLRMMHVRGDFDILIEPGLKTAISLYCSSLYDSSGKSSLKTFHDVEALIFQKLHNNQRNLFIKDTIFAASRYLLPENNFLKQQDYYVIFLIRNPHHALISFSQKAQAVLDVQTQNIYRDGMSYQKLYELYQQFKQKSVCYPLIILTEELVLDSQKTVMQFCKYVHIPFKDEHLSWQKLDKNFSFEQEWGCLHSLETSLHWFDKALASTKFTSENLPNYAVDQNGQPTFKEIANLEHRKFYKQLYDENLPYYQLFLKEHGL